MGILVSLLLLISLTYRGWNVVLIAPICALPGLLIGDLEAQTLAPMPKSSRLLWALPDQVLPALPARCRLWKADGRFGVRTDDRAQEQAAGLSPQILHRIAALASGGLDALPHNGAVITLLAICGLNHKQSYFDIFMVAVASRCWRW